VRNDLAIVAAPRGGRGLARLPDATARGARIGCADAAFNQGENAMTKKTSHVAATSDLFATLTRLADETERRAGCPKRFIAEARAAIAQANARLMAAAPDLLDALEDLVERDRSEAAESGFTDDEMTWLEDARRAIAKAKPLIA
jgi:hypothetical protein